MKRLITALLIFAIALTSYGCNAAGEEYEYYEVMPHRFYVNGEFLTTGDESLPPLLEDYNYSAHAYPEKPTDGTQYETVLDDLRKTPGRFENAETMVNDNISFNGVTVEDGTAFVDMSGDGLSGSSLVEGLLISQIVNSLIATFEEVERVQFLVDGEAAETLMGHYDVTEPYVEGIYNIEK